MKLILFLAFISIELAHAQSLPSENDPVRHPHLTNQESVKQIAGKPIALNLNHPAISNDAKLYYKRQFAISDDNRSFAMMDSLLTSNKQTRPFYFFIYNQMIKKADGAVAEFMAEKCAGYVKQFPCEFLAYAKEPANEVDRSKWAGFIGFNMDERDGKLYVSNLDKKVAKECPSNKAVWVKMSDEIKASFN